MILFFTISGIAVWSVAALAALAVTAGRGWRWAQREISWRLRGKVAARRAMRDAVREYQEQRAGGAR